MDRPIYLDRVSDGGYAGAAGADVNLLGVRGATVGVVPDARLCTKDAVGSASFDGLKRFYTSWRY